MCIYFFRKCVSYSMKVQVEILYICLCLAIFHFIDMRETYKKKNIFFQTVFSGENVLSIEKQLPEEVSHKSRNLAITLGWCHPCYNTQSMLCIKYFCFVSNIFIMSGSRAGARGLGPLCTREWRYARVRLIFRCSPQSSTMSPEHYLSL